MTTHWNSFSYDIDWLQDAIADEAACPWDVQVGGEPRSTSPPVIDPSQLQFQLQQVRLQSLLFGKLAAVLEHSNLGAGTDAAWTLGRHLIRARLAHLSDRQLQTLEALLTDPNPDSSPVLTLFLQSLLTHDDWQKIAHAASQSIESHLLHQVTLHLSA